MSLQDLCVNSDLQFKERNEKNCSLFAQITDQFSFNASNSLHIYGYFSPQNKNPFATLPLFFFDGHGKKEELDEILEISIVYLSNSFLLSDEEENKRVERGEPSLLFESDILDKKTILTDELSFSNYFSSQSFTVVNSSDTSIFSFPLEENPLTSVCLLNNTKHRNRSSREACWKKKTFLIKKNTFCDSFSLNLLVSSSLLNTPQNFNEQNNSSNPILLMADLPNIDLFVGQIFIGNLEKEKFFFKDVAPPKMSFQFDHFNESRDVFLSWTISSQSTLFYYFIHKIEDNKKELLAFTNKDFILLQNILFEKDVILIEISSYHRGLNRIVCSQQLELNLNK